MDYEEKGVMQLFFFKSKRVVWKLTCPEKKATLITLDYWIVILVMLVFSLHCWYYEDGQQQQKYFFDKLKVLMER